MIWRTDIKLNLNYYSITRCHDYSYKFYVSIIIILSFSSIIINKNKLCRVVIQSSHEIRRQAGISSCMLQFGFRPNRTHANSSLKTLGSTSILSGTRTHIWESPMRDPDWWDPCSVCPLNLSLLLRKISSPIQNNDIYACSPWPLPSLIQTVNNPTPTWPTSIYRPKSFV